MRSKTARKKSSSPLTWLVPLLVFVVIVAIGVVLDLSEQAGESPADARPPTAVAVRQAQATPGQFPFDFWVMALSWSPDYCATNGQRDVQQCGLGRKLGFVLHGLWPQYNVGYPSYCSAAKLPAELKARFPNLYPSEQLYSHEWEKHGTCSGLSPEQYLNVSGRYKESVTIPAGYRDLPQPARATLTDIKRDFVSVNSGLSDMSLAVFCSGSGRYLQELWVCIGLDGRPTSCSSEIRSRERRSCQGKDFIVRNMR